MTPRGQRNPEAIINDRDTGHPVHEVKYDGYRLRLERDGSRVHLITRGYIAARRKSAIERKFRWRGE